MRRFAVLFAATALALEKVPLKRQGTTTGGGAVAEADVRSEGGRADAGADGGPFTTKCGNGGPDGRLPRLGDLVL